MQAVFACLSDAHDHQRLLLAAVICVVGVYASFAVALHAGRAEGRTRRTWAAVSVVAAGCTAWATHMVALLAFRPGMQSGFDPLLTALSLVTAILGIGTGLVLVVGRGGRMRRFRAGVILGLGIAALHYLGQAGYLVTGTVSWNGPLVAASVVASLAVFGGALVASGERNRALRRSAAPLLLAAIALLHLCGIGAVTLTFDPRLSLPASAVPPDVIVPIVAGVCLGLLALAVLGLRWTLHARAEMRRDRERLRELADLAVEGLAICDGETIVSANRSLARLAGIDQDSLAGRRLSSLLPGLLGSNLAEREEAECDLLGADGGFVPVRVLRSEVTLRGKRQTVVAVRDQRERLRTEAAMRALAFSDALTGLPNRARFTDLVALHGAACRERGTACSVFLIDLDRFKFVNDTLGHGAGDALLRKVAVRLKSVLRETDVVARLGGDEFALLQLDAADPDAARADAARLAARVVDLLGRPFLLDGQPVTVGASVGVAVAPADGDRPADLLRNADLALYKAKADGRGAHRMFEPSLDARMQARRRLETDMRRALTVEEFEVHYQPLVDARTGAVTAAEALVRWRHPERGLVSPADFIPLAEETGLIGPLGAWVLRTACAHAATWPGDIRVAVNLSPVQFRDGRLVETVKGALAASGLPARRLELEITEGVMLTDEERTLATLIRLRAAGVSISMDDFGTGYSSLSYLRRFPFDKIKVDQSFVRQLPDDPESAGIIRAIISMGACLGMTTTVEGVETAEQYALVAAEGCSQVQGFHVSRPLPHADFLSFVGVREAA